ncbi:signal transduction histidine kinase [Candidatus Scalindua japonica]|uniref:Signal transduction histidine kinase n=1 Tax=Candidatus Scalindua japonica TaxID=1284222 RepID=A0A286TV15_9BACT|nr:signal transduction histidine kinase [Candidatus Scalindua japonica]
MWGGGGAFTQSGGTHTITNDLNIGEAAGSSGTYTLSSGTLRASNSYLGGIPSLCFRGSGTLNISEDGDAMLSVVLKLWDAGVVNLSGGMLKAATIDNTNGGSFNVTGGTLAVDTFLGDLSVSDAMLAPGDSPGVTSITGDYSQDIDSILQIEIGGLLAGSERSWTFRGR